MFQEQVARFFLFMILLQRRIPANPFVDDFYEQSILVQEKGDAVKKYYIVEVSPVVMNENLPAV